MKVAVAGTGYVGLSMAVLLSQHNEVRALDIVPRTPPSWSLTTACPFALTSTTFWATRKTSRASPPA